MDGVASEVADGEVTRERTTTMGVTDMEVVRGAAEEVEVGHRVVTKTGAGTITETGTRIRTEQRQQPHPREKGNAILKIL